MTGRDTLTILEYTCMLSMDDSSTLLLFTDCPYMYSFQHPRVDITSPGWNQMSNDLVCGVPNQMLLIDAIIPKSKIPVQGVVSIERIKEVPCMGSADTVQICSIHVTFNEPGNYSYDLNLSHMIRGESQLNMLVVVTGR